MLIIYAHPNKNGHCGEFLKEVEENLKEYEVNYEVLDLYALSFDPVLLDKDLHVKDKSKISKEILGYQEKIKNAKSLIFIYPTWWAMPPAILKGFFDKVLIADFAFKYVDGKPIALLNDKNGLIFSVSASSNFMQFLMCKPSVRIVQKYVLNFCGVKTKSYILGFGDVLGDRNKLRISKMVKKGLSGLYKHI